MNFVIVFFLFLGKHAWLSNVVDVGYTESRRHHSLAVCWMHLSYQILMESVGTLVLMALVFAFTYSHVHLLWHWETFIIAECLGMVLTWSVEKRANYSNLFLSHVLAELAFLGLYATLIVALYPF